MEKVINHDPIGLSGRKTKGLLSDPRLTWELESCLCAMVNHMESKVLVDEKREKWIKHYSSSHNILLVGEGDFSFAASLAEAFGSASNMVATSLDSKVANLKKLEDYGCTIVHEVDANTMSQHPLLKVKAFDRIVFNFPHAGLNYFMCEHSMVQIELHQNVVKGFLMNARDMLTENGQVHVTHKTSYPFTLWEITKLAEEGGLQLVEEVPFTKWDYPGYHNKRAYGYKKQQGIPCRRMQYFQICQSHNVHQSFYGLVILINIA
ncbi:unnamed protein product [Ilex paraguariensis]|uniref:25S rRNA (uridine-N(3))-methyltransferase BMT5-like domain-containing protein n=1 Tax=Ilex paraguariensis TaxID=185542 RepID=A0ABC8UX94_9AQUA